MPYWKRANDIIRTRAELLENEDWQDELHSAQLAPMREKHARLLGNEKAECDFHNAQLALMREEQHLENEETQLQRHNRHLALVRGGP